MRMNVTDLHVEEPSLYNEEGTPNQGPHDTAARLAPGTQSHWAVWQELIPTCGPVSFPLCDSPGAGAHLHSLYAAVQNTDPTQLS